jgi:hypothetical protein
MNSYIYLIQDGEFINTDVYKVGRTSQKGDTRSLSRIKSYNKETIQKYLREVNNEAIINIESDIKRVFKLKYKLIKGTEWFDGNYKQMISDIDIIINKYDENNIVKLIKNDIVLSEKNIDLLENIDINYFENKNIICFLNGVYNLDTDEFKQCTKFPNNCLTTGINFIEHPDIEDQEKMIQVEDFLNKIFPIEHVKKYVLTLLASFLHGSNKDQKFHIWAGGGSSGKTTLLNFYNKTIGEYSYNILNNNKTFFKDLSIPHNKRLVSLDNINIEKFISKIIKNTNFNNYIYITNELPKINSDDDDTWFCIRVVDCISNFCDNPDPKKLYEFMIDHELEKKLYDLREVFMYMLIQYFQKSYKINGVQEPKEVLCNTIAYRNYSDIYRQFKEEVLYEDKKSMVDMDTIFQIFKKFLFNTGINNQNKYTRNEFENRMNILLGKCSKRNPYKKIIWNGWKIILNNEDEI